MRFIKQPGIPTQDRAQWAEARGGRVRLELRKGASLLESVAVGFKANGYDSGCVRFAGAALAPFGYLMPALAKDTEHVAFYSDIFRPAGLTRVIAGSLTLGMRDGIPFFHAHGHWIESDGRRGGGHLVPEETFVAESMMVDAFGLHGARFATGFDEETRFPLFTPERDPAYTPTPAGKRAFAVRLKPNVDISVALEAFCRARGIVRATIQGGVGSLIGAQFTDGRVVEPFITEVAINAGQVVIADRADDQTFIDVAMVDHTGQISEGRLSYGKNPVLITFEIVLEVDDVA